MGNTPSEPGQPAPPNIHRCPICLKELTVELGLPQLEGPWVWYRAECPDRCALAADEPIEE